MKKALIIALIATVSACKADTKESARMFTKDDEMKAYCLGRNFISLPNSFSPGAVTTGTFRAAGLGKEDSSIEMVVRAAGMTEVQFASEVKKRGLELKDKGDDTVDILRMEKRLSEDAALFRVQQIEDAYVSEINLLRGSSVITLKLESYHGQFERAEEILLRFAAGIKESAAKNSAHLQGYCFGPVVITSDFKEGRSGIVFRDGKGDVFGLEMSTYATSDGDTLLSRMSSPDSLLSKFKVRHTVLRAGERVVAGMHAQEWLGWTNLGEEGGQKSFGFALETMPTKAEKARPSMTLSFDSAQPLEDGGQTNTWMSDVEAIHLWDSVVGSIRPVTD